MSSSQDWLSAHRHSNPGSLLIPPKIDQDDPEENKETLIRTPLPSGIPKYSSELLGDNVLPMYPLEQSSPFEPISMDNSYPMDPLGMGDAFPGEDLDKTVLSMKVPEMLLKYKPEEAQVNIKPEINNVASVSIESLQKLRERSAKSENAEGQSLEKAATKSPDEDSYDDTLLRTVVGKIPEDPMLALEALLPQGEIFTEIADAKEEEVKKPIRRRESQPSHIETTLGPTSDSAEKQTGGVRRYKDGMLATFSGESCEGKSGDFQAVVDLPYGSDDILMRLGNYDILSQLGEGAMGIVYKAYSVSLCRMCAIKVLKTNDSMTEAGILRFQNEAMLAARLRHNNIVSVFDSGQEDGKYYFVMEYVEGVPLTDIIEEGSEDSMWRGIRILAKVARALEYAHQFGIVHRDLKPDNIMVDQNDEPYITDFGIAKGVDLDLNITKAETMMGTPYYMSPEQANGEFRSVGPQSDIYSMGSTLYHLLVGKVPFDGDSLFSLIYQLIRKEPISPTTRAKKEKGRKLPADLETITLKCLEKEATRRYETADALADDLEAFLEDRPIAARPIGAVERTQKLLRRNRPAFVGAVLVLCVLMLVTLSFGAVLMFNMNQQSKSLRYLDQKGAMDQASTLEKAIRSNMLEGRADIVRALVGKLRTDRRIASIEVVRPDRTYAYTDFRTRKHVEKRVTDPEVLSWIAKKHPAMVKKVDELKRVGFINIDQSKERKVKKFKGFKQVWKSVAGLGRIAAKTTQEDGKKMLTVFWPIKNGKACEACHGSVGKSSTAYGPKKNHIRAVLVVKRSLKHVETQIKTNRMATLAIGATTSICFLFFLILFGKLFGVGLGKRKFGQANE